MLKISVCEHDGALHEDGLPRLVILSVSGLVENTSVALPYPAEKTLREVFADVQRLAATAPPAFVVVRRDMAVVDMTQAPDTIQPGAIVRLTKAYPSEDETGLVVGQQVRVLALDGAAIEVIDDATPRAMRKAILKADAVLVTPAPPKAAKVQVPETLGTCPDCKLEVVFRKEADGYVAFCDTCRRPVTLEKLLT